MSENDRHHLEYSLSSTLKDMYDDQVLFCPQHHVTAKKMSWDKLHSRCRHVTGFSNILFSELEIPKRLETIISLLYGKRKRIHHPCGSILHISSYEMHKSSCSVIQQKKSKVELNNEDNDLVLQVQVDDVCAEDEDSSSLSSEPEIGNCESCLRSLQLLQDSYNMNLLR
jgi:hypothetical protein